MSFWHTDLDRAIFLSVAQTLHMLQCIDALDGEEPEEPHLCPDWLREKLASPPWHINPFEP